MASSIVPLVFLAHTAAGRLAAPQLELSGGYGGYGMCAPQLFHIRSERFRNYSACIQDGFNSTDLTVTGANLAVKSECWCRFNMTYFMSEQGCAQHENWRLLSELECNPNDNCSSAESLQCMEGCPALCLETDYTMSGCKCRGCGKYLQCILEDSSKETASGLRNRTCDERAVLASGAWTRYHSCINRAPYRTGWDRHQAQQYCACSEGLQQELQYDSCCEVNGHGRARFALASMCEATCQVDCDTTEAQKCLQECASSCVEIDSSTMTEACRATCMASNSTCHKYSVCKPFNATPTLGYFCDDGSEPNENGCCGSPLEGGGCPTWCEDQQAYFFYSKSRQNMLTPQCKCDQCPPTKEETYRLMNQTWLTLYASTGERYLFYIARRLGLPAPTQDMERLFRAELADIAKAIADHGSYWNAALKAKIYMISDYWTPRIIRSGAEASGRFVFRPGSLLMKLFCFFLIPLLCTCALLVTMYSYKKLRAQGDDLRQGNAPIVVGRPVGPDVSETPDAIVNGVLLGRTAPGHANLPPEFEDGKVEKDLPQRTGDGLAEKELKLEP